jgi:hypothetical protein
LETLSAFVFSRNKIGEVVALTEKGGAVMSLSDLQAKLAASRQKLQTNSQTALVSATRPAKSQTRERAKPKSVDIAKTVPHSVEAEMGVLSSMLQLHGGSEAIEEARAKIGQAHFYVPAHRTIFIALCDLSDSGQAVDPITFTQSLRDKNLLDAVGGVGFITDLQTFVPTAANVAHYLDIVREKYVLRSIVFTARETARRAYMAQADVVETLTFANDRFGAISLNGAIDNLTAIEDAAAIVKEPIELPPDIIAGIIHAGSKVEIAGSSKSYKTWLMIDLGVSVATGAVWLNEYATTKGRVLYVNFELTRAHCFKRIQTVCDERQLTLEAGMLDVLNLRGRVKDWERLQRQITKGKYALIIIDPSYKLLHDETKPGDIARLLNDFEVLAERTGAAVAFAAHYSKGNQARKEAIDRVSGSGIWGRDPDTILTFTIHKEKDCFTVEIRLRSHPESKSFVVRWEFPIFTVDVTLDPTELKTPGRPKLDRAKDLMDIIDGPLSASEICVKAEKLDPPIPRRSVFELLTNLKRGGLLKQPKYRGKYEPV